MASFVVEVGGHEHVPFTKQDCRNAVKIMRIFQLGEGDGEAIHTYFLDMQEKNQDFFYMMDLNETGRLKNVFWANARSRLAYKHFDDVLSFDTTYLVNKWDMPFTPFVGVNHHSHSILLRCAPLLEDTISNYM